MKATTISTLLAVLAVAGVTLLYLRVERLSDDMRALSRRSAAEPGAVAIGEDRLRVHGPRVVPPAERGPTAERPEPGPETAALSRPDSRPRTLEERIADLEQRQRRIEEESPASDIMRGVGVMPRFARTVDELGKTLDLTPTQKARVADAVERGKRRVEDVLRIPDESGKSPLEKQEEQRKRMREALKNQDHSGLIAFATDLFGYRESKIPGRNATYGQEIDRIKKETREEISSALNSEQQETFEQTNIDPLLGAPGGAMSISVFSSDDGEQGERGAAIVVEGGVEIGEESPPASPSGAGEGTDRDG